VTEPNKVTLESVENSKCEACMGMDSKTEVLWWLLVQGAFPLGLPLEALT